VPVGTVISDIETGDFIVDLATHEHDLRSADYAFDDSKIPNVAPVRHARQAQDLLDVDRDGDEDETGQRRGRAGRGDEEVGPLAGA